MKKIVLAAGIAALAGCSQSEPAPEATPTEAATEAPAPTTGNGSPAGTYTVTAKDGTVTTSTLNADGTYTDNDLSGKVLAEGTWAQKDGKTCFTPTTEGEMPMCYAEGAAGPDGSFTATPDSGDPLTVKPAAVAAPAAETPEPAAT